MVAAQAARDLAVCYRLEVEYPKCDCDEMAFRMCLNIKNECGLEL